MLGATLKRLGCCGVLVWLMIGAVFATFFIGEYLERPEEQKSIWKAGVTVSEGGGAKSDYELRQNEEKDLPLSWSF